MTTTRRAAGAVTAGIAGRVAAGAACGAVATLVMSWLMLTGVAAGASPMPKPVPVALVAHQFGELAPPRLFASGLLLHFGYGAAAGAVLALAPRWADWRWGMAYGVLLWLVMGTLWLPYLGWGPFGTGTGTGTGADGAIAVATLLLHLVYGAVLGLLLRHAPRSRRPATTTAAAAGVSAD